MGNDHNEPYLWRERWRCVTTPSWGGATSQCDATASEHSREPNLCVLLLTRAVRKLCDSCSERMGKSRQNGACGPARADARGGSLTGADASLCICTTIIMMVIMRKQHCSATRAHVGGWGDGGALVCVLLFPWRLNDSYLVDPASSHMLVSKIKPCMSKYERLYTVKLRMAH